MSKYSAVFFGPCQKLNRRTGTAYEAFCPESRSGKFLRSIVDTNAFPKEVNVRFDNIIASPVYDKEGKERNPTVAELVKALERHKLWKSENIDILVGLSASVREALETVHRRRRESNRASGPMMLFAEHPSFMMRRPHSERVNYSARLQQKISGAIQSLGS